MEEHTCYHCGDPSGKHPLVHDDKPFCCRGCITVYQLLSESGLGNYYEIAKAPGATPNAQEGKYDFLDNSVIAEKLLAFDDGKTQVVSLYIPQIHCSSCIWVLENLHKLHDGVTTALVNCPKKSARITFNVEKISLKELVVLLNRIGYEPYISLEDLNAEKKSHINRDLLYKLGVAGFAFGNVMLLSFPEYFETSEFWLDQYKGFFRWLMFAFSLPVVFYAANDYFTSAYKGLKAGFLNIDVPIVLGIMALFLRSSFDIALDLGSGFFDSLTGLVFFLLLGKFFQQKTYAFLSFERDYKSYFPISVTRVSKAGEEENIPLDAIEKGDRLLIRNEELIPVDCVLMEGKAQIDYSFVTGEAAPVEKQRFEQLYAGGKQLSGLIQVEALKSVQQSYLTQLWSNDIFNKEKENDFQSFTNYISKYFTAAVLSIALASTALV